MINLKFTYHTRNKNTFPPSLQEDDLLNGKRINLEFAIAQTGSGDDVPVPELVYN